MGEAKYIYFTCLNLPFIRKGGSLFPERTFLIEHKTQQKWLMRKNTLWKRFWTKGREVEKPSTSSSGKAILTARTLGNRMKISIVRKLSLRSKTSSRQRKMTRRERRTANLPPRKRSRRLSRRKTTSPKGLTEDFSRNESSALPIRVANWCSS